MRTRAHRSWPGSAHSATPVSYGIWRHTSRPMAKLTMDTSSSSTSWRPHRMAQPKVAAPTKATAGQDNSAGAWWEAERKLTRAAGNAHTVSETAGRGATRRAGCHARRVLGTTRSRKQRPRPRATSQQCEQHPNTRVGSGNSDAGTDFPRGTRAGGTRAEQAMRPCMNGWTSTERDTQTSLKQTRSERTKTRRAGWPLSNYEQ